MMSPTECINELQRRKDVLPFVPFEIETLEGGRFQVVRRMGFAASDRTILVIDSSDRGHRVPVSKVKTIRNLSVKTL
jgi:hypothetical protein